MPKSTPRAPRILPAMRAAACSGSLRSKRPVALDLGAVHDAAALRIERIAAVHHATVVPQDQVARPPLLVPLEFRLRRMRPQRVEQGFALCERQPRDVGVAAAAEEQGLLAGNRMSANDRVLGADRLAGIGGVDKAAAQ